MKITTLAALITATLMCLNTQAAYIKVVFCVSSDFVRGPETSYVEMVFDTSVPPEVGPDNSYLYYPVTAFISTSVPPAAEDKILTASIGPQYLDTSIGSHTPSYASLRYFPNGNIVELIVAAQNGSGQLSITDMPAAFNPLMDSLPDDTNDWAFNQKTSEFHGYSSNRNNDVTWHSEDEPQFQGGTLTYGITTVPLPADTCSTADLNEDGELDFFDLSAFLKIFSEGCRQGQPN